uniref:EGF-like domain-containing protein n=1 Tax=Callorhinchus milii TaxID=7868 RepID=A0A4W3HC60_CALMI
QAPEQTFTGHYCEVNVDDCQGHQCRNGGRCVDGINTYTCHCPPQWEGPLCSRDVVECEQRGVCENGGTCINMVGGYVCVCVNGWSGDRCTHNINDCRAALCSEGATCHDRVASFTCECPPGRTGRSPSVDINECSMGESIRKSVTVIIWCLTHTETPNPCEHSGRCENTMGSFWCRCRAGYSGARCELDIKECLSNPCLNGATCLDEIGEFKCICMSALDRAELGEGGRDPRHG